MLLFCLCTGVIAQETAQQSNEPKMNSEKVLEYKEVFQVEGMSAEQIFINLHQMLSEWSYDKNSKNSIDFEDKESGVIMCKLDAHLGFQKANMLYGWDLYALCNISIKIKDGRYQVTVKVPSVRYKWSAGGIADDTAIDELYPTYTAKKKNLVKHKKVSESLVPTIPDVMKSVCQSIAKKVKSSEEDDF